MSTHGKTFMNAVVGAVVTVVLSFLPFSPTVGGFVSGYLQRGGIREGAKAGGLAGLFALLPLFLALVIVVPVFVIAPFGVPNLPLNSTLFVFGLFWLVGFYTVGLGLLGGIIGTYLAGTLQATNDA